MRKGGDFDRRMALISFDNSIEVSISTYLTLHPSQRQERKYSKRDVEKWQENYHSKLDFLQFAIEKKNSEWKVSRTEITWVHSYRNKQYHGSTLGVPETKVIEVARSAAIWVFSLLFRVNDVEDELDKYQEYGRIEQEAQPDLSAPVIDRPTATTTPLAPKERLKRDTTQPHKSGESRPIDHAIAEAILLIESGKLEDATKKLRSFVDRLEDVDSSHASYVWSLLGYLLQGGENGKS